MLSSGLSLKSNGTQGPLAPIDADRLLQLVPAQELGLLEGPSGQPMTSEANLEPVAQLPVPGSQHWQSLTVAIEEVDATHLAVVGLWIK